MQPFEIHEKYQQQKKKATPLKKKRNVEKLRNGEYRKRVYIQAYSLATSHSAVTKGNHQPSGHSNSAHKLPESCRYFSLSLAYVYIYVYIYVASVERERELAVGTTSLRFPANQPSLYVPRVSPLCYFSWLASSLA